MRFKKKIASILAIVILVATFGGFFQFIQDVHAETLSDEPVYNASSVNDVLKYAQGSEILTLAPGTKHDFGVTIPEDETYYVSFSVQTQKDSKGNIWFVYREQDSNNTARLLIDKAQYYMDQLSGDPTKKYVQKNPLLNSGEKVKVTIKSMPNKVSIWMNGEKVEDDVSITLSGVGKPRISGVNNDTATISDVKIWTEATASLDGYSATLDGMIGMNFIMNVDLEEAIKNSDETYMIFRIPGEAEQKIILNSLGTDAIINNWKYKFTCKVPAKKMMDTIKAQFYVNGEACGDVYEQSVAEYAKVIIEDTTNYTEQARNLAESMLHYGAYSQQYFSYNLANLANNSLEKLDLSTVNEETFSVNATSCVKQLEDLGEIKGSNLMLESETTLKLYFKPVTDVNADDLEFTYNSEVLPTLKYTSCGETWICILIANIEANELDKMIEVEVTNGTISGILKYSVLNYGYNVLKGSQKTSLQNLVKALYCYNQAAHAYENSLL